MITSINNFPSKENRISIWKHYMSYDNFTSSLLSKYLIKIDKFSLLLGSNKTLYTVISFAFISIFVYSAAKILPIFETDKLIPTFLSVTMFIHGYCPPPKHPASM